MALAFGAIALVPGTASAERSDPCQNLAEQARVHNNLSRSFSSMAMVLINTGNTSQETLDMIETYIQWSQDYAALATEDMADFAGLC
ncbi:MAG TPA: hypothetical protein VGF22_05910 [Acidimicrobiales bacterium]